MVFTLVVTLDLKPKTLETPDEPWPVPLEKLPSSEEKALELDGFDAGPGGTGNPYPKLNVDLEGSVISKHNRTL